MKRHLTLATTSEYVGAQYGTAAPPAPGRADTDSYVELSASGIPATQRALGESAGWRHTLVLTGRLDARSAVELEDEIECLREEGVSTLTLDLRQLEGIDSAGARVIASQSALFKGGGRRFAVIPGGLVRHSLLAQARLRNRLGHAAGERFVPRFANPRTQEAGPGMSTRMVKHLVPFTHAEAS